MSSSRTVTIDAWNAVLALVFLEDGKHLVSGGEDGIIRQWNVEDGKEDGQAFRATSAVWAIAASSDRNWIVSGDAAAAATVWNRKTRQCALSVSEHRGTVYAVDVSPDSTKFATGSRDSRAFIWDISTGRRLVGPFLHDHGVISVRFSPGGDRIATATWERESLRVYDAYSGEWLADIPVISNARNSIAWSGDSQYIFALSSDVLSQIHVESRSLHSRWTIPGETLSLTGSIALSSDGKFVAAFVGSSLSFWDPHTRRRLGSVFEHSGRSLRSIALSLDNKRVATGGEDGIVTIRHLSNIIPKSPLVGQRGVQRRQLGTTTETGAGDLQQQIKALRGALHALEIRVGELTRTTKQMNDRLDAQATSLRVLDGTYRIKSIIGNIYLSCPQDGPGAIVVRRSDPEPSASQKWTISSGVDGAYSIVGRTGNLDVYLSTGDANQLVCIPSRRSNTWTFEPRGDAYVIGNAVDVTAIHLAQNRQSAAVTARNNSRNQRWILERASN